MRLLVVNPNTSLDTTAAIRTAAMAAASPGTTIEAVTALRGPAELKSPAQSEQQGPVVVETMLAHAAGMDAAIIAAFSDPGLALARQRFAMPVIGIGEAVMTEAAAHGRFVLIVPNPANEPIYRRHVEVYGVGDRLIAIRYIYPRLRPGEGGPADIRRVIAELARAAQDEDHADAVAIGGGPLAGTGSEVQSMLSIAVFESVPAAVRLAERRVMTVTNR